MKGLQENSECTYLSELDEVLLAVDDRDRAVGVPASDVARAEPPAALGVHEVRIGRVLLVLVVTEESVGPHDEQLARGGRVGAQIPHVGDVGEPERVDHRRGPARADVRIIGQRDRRPRGALGHAVALRDPGVACEHA